MGTNCGLIDIVYPAAYAFTSPAHFTAQRKRNSGIPQLP